jgi:PIN domain nuclease of toxin-antitoxin system
MKNKSKSAINAIHEEPISRLLIAQATVTWVEAIITPRDETIERGDAMIMLQDDIITSCAEMPP